MKKSFWTSTLPWIFLAEGTGILSGLISREGIENFSQNTQQPALSPPAILFPIVWTILYALMGISAGRIAATPDSPRRQQGLNLFVAQLIINFFWSPIFFNTGAYSLAFMWILLLIGLVIAMILTFRKVDPLAAVLQIPYLLWLIFAAYLNYVIWQLNS